MGRVGHHIAEATKKIFFRRYHQFCAAFLESEPDKGKVLVLLERADTKTSQIK